MQTQETYQLLVCRFIQKHQKKLAPLSIRETSKYI